MKKLYRTGFISVVRPSFPLQQSFDIPFFPVLGSYFVGTEEEEGQKFICIEQPLKKLNWYRVLMGFVKPALERSDGAGAGKAFCFIQFIDARPRRGLDLIGLEKVIAS